MTLSDCNSISGIRDEFDRIKFIGWRARQIDTMWKEEITIHFHTKIRLKIYF